MSFYTYILKCADGSYYTGHTEDLEVRLQLHSEAPPHAYTSTRLPVKLVGAEEFPTRIEALEAERQIKGWSRAKKEALILGDWDELSRLAKSHGGGAAHSSTASGQDSRGSTGSPRTGSGRASG